MAQYRHDPSRVNSRIPEPGCRRMPQIVKTKVFETCISTCRTKTSLNIGSRLAGLPIHKHIFCVTGFGLQRKQLLPRNLVHWNASTVA